MKIKLNEQNIIIDYVKNKLSTGQIAKKLNVPNYRIKYILEKNKVILSPDKDPHKMIGPKNIRWTGYGEISGSTFHKIKNLAVQRKNRKLEFSITIEYMWNLFLEQNRKCVYSDIILTFAKHKKEHTNSLGTASLDRIDSSKGYIKGNVQWVHKKINIMKQAMSHEEFIEWCKLIAKKYNRKK